MGYILDDRFWGKGYAAEGAQACLNYAFSVLHAPRVIADIRPENTASRRVAARLGMQEEGVFDKFYYGKHMPHIIYAGISAGFTRCKECGILTAIDRSKGSAHNDRDVVFQEKKPTKMTILLHYHRIRNERL